MSATTTPLSQQPLTQAGRAASRNPHAKAAPRHRHARVPRVSRGDSFCSAYMIKEGSIGLDLITPLGPFGMLSTAQMENSPPRREARHHAAATGDSSAR